MLYEKCFFYLKHSWFWIASWIQCDILHNHELHSITYALWSFPHYAVCHPNIEQCHNDPRCCSANHPIVQPLLITHSEAAVPIFSFEPLWPKYDALRDTNHTYFLYAWLFFISSNDIWITIINQKVLVYRYETSSLFQTLRFLSHSVLVREITPKKLHCYIS